MKLEGTTEAQSERRSERRRRVLLRAKVSGVGRTAAIDCSIRDASRSGCKLISKDVATLPTDILLTISGISEPIRGQVIWQDQLVAGVKFIWDEAAAGG